MGNVVDKCCTAYESEQQAAASHPLVKVQKNFVTLDKTLPSSTRSHENKEKLSQNSKKKPRAPEKLDQQ